MQDKLDNSYDGVTVNAYILTVSDNLGPRHVQRVGAKPGGIGRDGEHVLLLGGGGGRSERTDAAFGQHALYVHPLVCLGGVGGGDYGDSILCINSGRVVIKSVYVRGCFETLVYTLYIYTCTVAFAELYSQEIDCR